MTSKTTDSTKSVPAGGIVTVGNFDGVHRGHQHMLSQLRQIAGQQNTHTVVVTFDPHPVTVLRPGFVKEKLTTPEHRARLLKEFGADHVVILPTNRELLNLSPEDFCATVILSQLHAAGVVEGPNFCFGRNRAGNVETLRQLCSDHGISFCVIDPVVEDDSLISSSRIRDLLRAGEVKEATHLLGHYHRIAGTVTQGAGRGRELGIPTANLTDVVEMLPAHGVYAGICYVDDSQYTTAISIGPNPTFGDKAVKVECHLIDYSGDLYGRHLSVDLVSEIRPLRSFSSSEDLTGQIAEDIRTCISLV
jgi:riboflavin kinase/FMN adenylyltransferase